MSVVLSSPSVVSTGGVPDPFITKELNKLASTGLAVAVISNNPMPSWFGSAFPGGKVQFVQWPRRQDGSVITKVSTKYKIPVHDFIVLGKSDEDVQMAKNGGAVLVTAGWHPVSPAAGYGISVANGVEFSEVVGLVGGWPGAWYYEGTESRYSVRALANVSGKNVSDAQANWARQIVGTVKGGGPRLMALLTVGARSLLMSGIVKPAELMFGLYPSSSSRNNDDEVLSDFNHRLRTVTSRVRFAKKGEPLLVRHTHSTKRSRSGAADRTDPSEQMESLHINPVYRDKVADRHVVVLDDCTTYGVSFGVASALLRKAGAASVSCVALGKFGNQLRYYEIDIKANPFAAIGPRDYSVRTTRTFNGVHHNPAQTALRGLIH